MMVDKSANVLDIIEKISSIDFQRDVWIEAKYWDRLIDFDEAVNTLEDYNFFDDINQNIIGLTKEDLDKVQNFSNKLLSYETRAAHDMITDKNWIEITKEAQVVFIILKRYSW